GGEGLLPHGIRTVPEALGEAGRLRAGPGAVRRRRELGDDEGEQVLLGIDDMVERALAQAAAGDDAIERGLLVGSGGELLRGGLDERSFLRWSHSCQCSRGHNRRLAAAERAGTGGSNACYRVWTTRSRAVAREATASGRAGEDH